jgi:hypothetical protein
MTLTPRNCNAASILDIKGSSILEIPEKGLLLCTSGVATSLLIAYRSPEFTSFYYDDTSLEATAGHSHLFRGLQVALTKVTSEDSYEYEYNLQLYTMKPPPHLVGVNEVGTVLIWKIADLRAN